MIGRNNPVNFVESRGHSENVFKRRNRWQSKGPGG